ncbi:hypothetical protein EON67_07445, partial [archaeon]
MDDHCRLHSSFSIAFVRAPPPLPFPPTLLLPPHIMKWRAKCDDMCGYETPRMVRIRDCRLGVLHYTLMFGVFCYIGIYSILIQQRYKLKAIDIVGSTRLQLRPPAAQYSTPPSQT